MKRFMDEDFLLSTETSRTLYHKYAAPMPILDYHCHISPREIAEDHAFSSITEAWLGGDHYKWRLMRAAGVEEALITGDAPDEEKFLAWAKVLSRCIGNPIYHWSHLELKRYFGFEGALTEQNAKEVWTLCNARLADSSMRARGIIKRSRVTLICTTDDPADSLQWHEQIASDPSFDVKVLPAWRPDKAMNLEKPDYPAYLKTLSEAAGIGIGSFAALKEALRGRMDFFEAHGCLVSDHGLEFVMYRPVTDEQAEAIFARRLAGVLPTREEELQFKTAFMLFAGSEYAKRGWVMQLHYGCKRNNNTAMFQKLGPDTGYDCIDNHTPSAQLSDFLNALESSGCLPKTLVYSLNPGDLAAIQSVIGCFQGEGVSGKLQQGSAWWFNDSKTGMTDQLTATANLGYLASFVGMLTDSRSFLSYTRHEYFRRILCDFLGRLVENGEYPEDYDILGGIVEDISYRNAARYFRFPLQE